MLSESGLLRFEGHSTRDSPAQAVAANERPRNNRQSVRSPLGMICFFVAIHGESLVAVLASAKVATEISIFSLQPSVTSEAKQLTQIATKGTFKTVLLVAGIRHFGSQGISPLLQEIASSRAGA